MTQDSSQNSDDLEELPEILPIFPLAGVLLLPGGQLPLNIFEEQYLKMVEDSLKESRLIGMIQPQEDQTKTNGSRPVFQTGCAGKITSFSETSDGRYEIVLTGLSRFEVREELDRRSGYRRIRPCWQTFRTDLELEQHQCLDIDRDRLYSLLQAYFDMHDITCSWSSIEAAPDSKLITALSMICPLECSEKQGLLEARDCVERAEMFMTMLELAIHGSDTSSNDHKH